MKPCQFKIDPKANYMFLVFIQVGSIKFVQKTGGALGCRSGFYWPLHKHSDVNLFKSLFFSHSAFPASTSHFLIMDNATAVNPRPTLTLQQATELTQQLYGVTVTEITTLPSYSDQNFLVADKEGTKYVLKILNSVESKNTTLMEVQTLTMSFLRQHGVPAQTAVYTTTGQLMSMEEIDCGHGAQTYCVRLLSYLPGKTIAESPVTTWDLHNLGKLAASMDKTLQQLVSPNLDALQKDSSLWSLSYIPLMEGYLSVMDGDPLQEVIQAVIEQFKSHVQPKISSFQKGIIHGDLNDQNIIVTPVANGHHEVSGILDFSLLTNGCYVFEVAILIAYLMLENPSPLDVGGAVLAGWESVMMLNDDERDSLFLLVLCRLCQSLVYGRYNVKKYPDNKKYLLTTARNGTRLLTKLWELGKKEVERKWFIDSRTYSDS
ncbi:hydroxylysine kinase-like isoform X1 [Seriola aureovittata]|uniref:hydroxylysine kinase-like isoform X1 n=1 Tax=Seriola aureovittata TaxID=2871759 RepID=UPI0024BE8553|nr:hydroxylysine kinase-like isoform X1 [Seriola aureovittata]